MADITRTYFSTMDDDADDPETPKLIARLVARAGASCILCRRRLCHHETILSALTGLLDAPRCASCLEPVWNGPWAEVRESVLEHVGRRACYRAAWAWASTEENMAMTSRPDCLWSDGGATPPAAPRNGDHGGSPLPSPDAEYDAGDLGCGDLLMELRRRILALRPGAVLRLRTTDPGAPADVPAWCRLTGHTLVAAAPPAYDIRRKE